MMVFQAVKPFPSRSQRSAATSILSLVVVIDHALQ
jgi:hypothetical protein